MTRLERYKGYVIKSEGYRQTILKDGKTVAVITDTVVGAIWTKFRLEWYNDNQIHWRYNKYRVAGCHS